MKKSFHAKYHSLLIVLFAIIVLQAVLLLAALGSATNLQRLVSDMQSIIIIFLFVIFVYMIVIYNYIPFRLSRALKEIKDVIDDITDGKYTMELNESIYDNDPSIQSLVVGLRKMLNVILRFDNLKAEKIYEHNQRIISLISLVEDPIIILSGNAEVVYINDMFRTRFSSIVEGTVLTELLIKDDLQSSVVKAILSSIRNGTNLKETRIASPDNQAGVSLLGSVIRNRKGNASGGVYIMRQI